MEQLLRSLMVLQVILIQHVVHESGRIFHSGGIRLGIRTVERQMPHT